MPTLWGSNKDDQSNNGDETPRDNGANQGSGSHGAPSHEREPDERTHLIPREDREPRGGYLSPDDPAVSKIVSTVLALLLTMSRYLRTISGAFVPSATSLSSSSASHPCGGCCCSSPSSSVHLACILADPASSMSRIPH